MALVNKSSNKKENTRLLATVGTFVSPRYPYSHLPPQIYYILIVSKAFTARLEELLLGPIDILPSLADSLQGHISGVVLIPLAAIASKSRELDERATKIWNLTSKLKYKGTLGNEIALSKSGLQCCQTILSLISIVRAFACLLLDRAQQTGGTTVTSSNKTALLCFRVALTAEIGDLRSLKTLLKASRCCLGRSINSL